MSNNRIEWSRKVLDGNGAFDRAEIVQTTGSLLKVVHFRGGDLVYDNDDLLVLSMALTTNHALEYRTSGFLTRVVPVVGSFGLMTPGRRFRIALQGNCSVLQLVVPRRQVVEWLEEDHAVDRRRVEIVWGHSLEDPQIGRLLLQARLSEVADQGVALRGIATRLFERFSAHPRALRRSRGGLAPGKLRRVLDRIGDEPVPGLTVDDLAREIALSPFHFARQFHQTTGRSPHRFIVERRVSRAIELMRNRRLSIAIIAERSGFANASHLSRQTRRMLGQSPAELRRALLD